MPYSPSRSVHRYFKPKSRLPFRTARAGFGLLLFLFIVCCAGALYQIIETYRDGIRFPPPGRRVNVGGHLLHLQVYGNGSPTVILETGLSGMSSAWAWIQPEVAKFARVVSYDRAGLGWSEADGERPTAFHVAKQLHRMLKEAGIEGPYVMVGHSMGGLYIRAFAKLYPKEVAGMVLVDAAHPDQYLRNSAYRKHMDYGFRILAFAPLLARLGILRVTHYFSSQAEGLPEPQRQLADVFLCSTQHISATTDELSAWEETAQQVRQCGYLGDIPLCVVSAGKGTVPGAELFQAELCALSSSSSRRIVKDATHVSLVTSREHAQVVAEAIREVVNQATACKRNANVTCK